MKTGEMINRRYRNRRIGEFLKELDFTEGRRTGIPKMRRALIANGSPEPTFYTDAARLSFWTEIKVHPEFFNERVPTIFQKARVEAQVEAEVKLSETELKILQSCSKQPLSNKEILSLLGYKSLPGNLKKALKKLKDIKAIEYTIPETPKSQHQKNRITKKGIELLEQYMSNF